MSLDGRVSWESQSLRMDAAPSRPNHFPGYLRASTGKLQSSGSQAGVILPPGGTSGDFWIHFQLGYWYLVGQVRGAAKHPTSYRTPPNNKEASAL